ncbi:hypothetical protein [Pseudoxanthomonas winnipegensis]|uniref:DUF4234 domain-containing protein n=1 Tax=Pseudoxanthomonas winnipegensis TaxID=2480810 RepID=A0A4Q8LLE0_9GAMM|nr:hypothetical protein [Pseudoxanthomonas winnipegensis]RZZ86222.1 hypothetical protein EA662_09950 [Pseudoxanthomonas winnipegensis]TAA31359.1 hypothetical protein EA661_07255 [Pseudoxanthomonas winnipegensis]TAA41238.1 hypothetical protein EAT51_09200 [Pseudoxanthomonas winnipegensis]TBV70180.1 hypothetical protein EYC46_18535 [Pseudoxanthomonas winnipegensis]
MELQAENPYQSPRAPLDSAPAAPAIRGLLLYAPPAWKFLLLSFSTLNLYLLIWFYRNWVAVRRARQVSLSPVARAFFSDVTAYFCFKQMEDLLAKRLERQSVQLHGGLMALLYLALSVMAYTPDPFSMIAILAPLPVLWVNLRVRATARSSAEDVCADGRLSWGAWTLVVLGFCLFALGWGVEFFPDSA